MKLKTTHNAFLGTHYHFNYFRSVVAAARGWSFPPHHPGLRLEDETPPDERYWYGDTPDCDAISPGLAALMNHLDSGGKFTPEECRMMADEIEVLLPKIDEKDFFPPDRFSGWAGSVARQWINGCRRAAARNEKLVFT